VNKDAASLGITIEAFMELKAALDKSNRLIADLQTQIEFEKNKYQNLLRELYGKKSEKVSSINPNQGELFDEAEHDAEVFPKTDIDIKQSNAAKRQRKIGDKKLGRRSIPTDLPRVEKPHDLTDEEKQCPCCGKNRPKIGEERSEEITFIPAHALVTVHVRMKYGPCKCKAFAESENKTIITAKAPNKIVPGSAFGNNAIAFFIVAKYADGLPFYRQESMMSRYDFEVNRGTMAHIAINTASRLHRIISFMQRDIRNSPIIGMDETVVQVLKEAGRDATTQSRMWIARAYHNDKPIVLFSYNKSRSSNVAASILGDFKGYLQTDGYSGYSAIGKQAGMTHIGCWAHIRRKFYSIYENNNKDSLALEIITLIKKIYGIERRLRKKLEEGLITKADFVTMRCDETKEVFESIQKWLMSTFERIPPKSPMGSAVTYALGQYDRAIRYVDHYLLTPDNNLVENAIRPFVIGRNNWKFYDSVSGAWAGATLYSIIETAKINGHEPYRYLCHLFENLPLAIADQQVEALLPYNLDPKNY